MRTVLASGLAVLVALGATSVHADPATPQASPGHTRREDARLLARTLRDLDPEPVPAPVVAPVRPRSPGAVAPRRDAVVRRDKPLLRRWWFLMALGAVTVTAVGVTYEAIQSDTSGLPGISCDASGCRQ
jgi:hypothetical protein